MDNVELTAVKPFNDKNVESKTEVHQMDNYQPNIDDDMIIEDIEDSDSSQLKEGKRINVF